MNKGLKRIKIIGLVIASVLVFSAIASFTVVVLEASSEDALPVFASKDTNQALGTSENPYTILEIVPNKESAMIGYLIGGQEPRNLLSIGATNKNDSNSAAGIYASAFTSQDSPSSTIGDYTQATIFEQDKVSIGTTPISGFTEKKDEYKSEADPGTDKAYSELGYFTKVKSGDGEYNYDNFKKAFVPVTGEAGGNFTWTCIGTFEYVGFGQGNCAREMYNGDDTRTYSYNYNDSEGAVGSSAYKYTYSNAGDFKWVPNSKYNNEDIFAENATSVTDSSGNERTLIQAVVGDSFLMTRTENVYYEYQASQIASNDLLLKNLVGEGTTGINYKTQVVTVTPTQLKINDFSPIEKSKAKELIDTADMIIVHDSSTGYKISQALQGNTVTDENVPRFINLDASRDLTKDTVDAIINRGAGANPAAIIFDEEAINKSNSYSTSSQRCVNLKRLYDVYNNLGAKLAYNWMSSSDYESKLTEAKKEKNYRNFTYEEADALGKSHFVYNYVGNDDSWFTTGFADENKIAKSGLNAAAFNNMGLDAEDAKMSVAKMLSAINKESNGYNQPDKLRILEIQPNEKYYYDASNKDAWVKYYLDLFPWFIGTDSDITTDLTITKMPTWEFIGKNEDPNEKYDLILVGNKQQDETNGIYGYNDALPNLMAYTAVGDLITTFGGDEVADKNIENNEDYKWHYGLFRNNKWSWTQHAYIEKDQKWWVYSGSLANFKKGFVYDYYDYKNGTDIFDGYGTWWYDYNEFDVFGTKHGSDANMIGLRYSGNDLTKKKYDQLMDFSNQGPVIVANELYDNYSGTSETPNTYVVDESSFVYQLANKNTDASAVNKYANASTGKLNDVKEQIESDTVSASFTNTQNGQAGLPTEYDANADVNYNMQKDGAGNNVLQYHFVLNGNDESVYGVNVYTDSNSNGIFEGCINHLKERAANGDTKPFDSERSVTLEIFDETDRTAVYDGVLKNGHTYMVTKIMPASDVGMIPWKIEIYNQNKDSVRYSKEGYTRIKPNDSSQVKKIKVLQMNLKPYMNSNAENTVNFADKNSTEGKKFAQYIKTLEDFKIEIEYMDNKTWYLNYSGEREAWASKLMEYDMLVIGFCDSANFTNNEDYLYGFNKFKEAGKSVILSHDLVQDVTFGIPVRNMNYNTDAMIQSDVRYYLRDISGQIRKYFDAESGGNDYSYMDYHSYGRALTFEPSDNFAIFTSLKETRRALHLIEDNYMWMEMRYKTVDGYNQSPIYDKYTYTYGAFGADADKYLYHETYGYKLTTPNTVVRDYYTTHDYKKANMIMDNSIRAMLYYNYIYYVENTKYGPKKGFVDRIDRLVRNINLDKSSERRQLIWGYDAFLTNKVEEANEGQITKYPFDIPDSLFVADTHAQNYQLDLEYDNDGDVLVWYNLAGTSNRSSGKSAVDSGSISVYDGRNQDSRNNYYIYTKGNITYTGLGHSKRADSPMTDDEIKLFINTMVAAYRSGASDPYVTVTNLDAVNNGKNTVMFLEDRDSDGSNTAITYRIDDNTTNSKINRTYRIKVYKGDELIDEINPASKSEGYSIPVSYSEVKANSEVKYRIVLESSYKNDEGVIVNTTDTRNVSVNLMPMFNIR